MLGCAESEKGTKMFSDEKMPGFAKPEAEAGSARVLLVEDDERLRRAMTRILESDGFIVEAAQDGREAFALIERGHIDVVVSDVAMPNMTGLELLAQVRRFDMELPVILVTGGPSEEDALEAKKYGALNYLAKPLDPDRLLTVLARAERLRRMAIAKRMAMDLLDSQLPRAGDLAGLEHSLDDALDTLWIAYQPILRASDGSLFGYEALMRTRSSALPHPGAVLDAAERLNRLNDVGRQIRTLAPGPLESSPSKALLFVNLHASDLNDPQLLDPSSPLVKTAHRVVLEVTERATLDKVNEVSSRINDLRSLGFRIAIDDLGAGYAGLTSFALLEPEIVKLDMTLVRDVASSPAKSKLIQAFCGVCRDMNALVVAEGIETREERDHLIDLGCNLLQGYLHAKPGPAFPEFSWGG